jgi:hypothetical protein
VKIGIPICTNRIPDPTGFQFKQSATNHIHFQFIQVVILVVIKAVTILSQKLDIFVDHQGNFTLILPGYNHNTFNVYLQTTTVKNTF